VIYTRGFAEALVSPPSLPPDLSQRECVWECVHMCVGVRARVCGCVSESELCLADATTNASRSKS